VTIPSPQVAVVGDEEPVRRGLERLLKTSGYTVESFASGGLFLASLTTRQPDCLVLDLHMPDPDGFAVLARLAELGTKIRVVVITGYDTPESRERALRSGIAAYLRKPLDGDVLLDAIRGAPGTP
jgi:two-component system response regulator FixJ